MSWAGRVTISSLHTLPHKLLCHTLFATLFATLLVLPGLLFKGTGGGHHCSGNAYDSPASPTRAASSWWASLLPWHFPDSKKPSLHQDLPLCCCLAQLQSSFPWQLIIVGKKIMKGRSELELKLQTFYKQWEQLFLLWSKNVLTFGMQLRCDKVLMEARDEGKAFDESIKIPVNKSQKYQISDLKKII